MVAAERWSSPPAPPSTPRPPRRRRTACRRRIAPAALRCSYRNPGQLGSRWRARRRRLGLGRPDRRRAPAAPDAAVTLAVGDHVRLPRTYRGRDIYWWMHDHRPARRALRRRSPTSSEPDGCHPPSSSAHPSDEPRPRHPAAPPASRITGRARRRHRNLRPVLRIAREPRRQRRSQAGPAPRPHRPPRRRASSASARSARSTRTDPAARRRQRDPARSVRDRRVGHRSATRRLLARPDLLDRRGQIAHDGGIADVPGLYVLGLPFTRRRSSGLIAGIASDAVELTEHLRRQLDRRSTAA